MEKMRYCFDCKSESPESEGDYTLISSGWRVARRLASDGEVSFVWRCPACWASYKALTGVSTSGSVPRFAMPPYPAYRSDVDPPATTPQEAAPLSHSDSSLDSKKPPKVIGVTADLGSLWSRSRYRPEPC
jgi:muconolactone delta-isomerase